MALIDLTGTVETVSVVDFTKKIANIFDTCTTARNSTTKDNIKKAYEVAFVAHSQLQALEVIHTRVGILQLATDHTNKDWNSFSVEYADVMDTSLPAFFGQVEGLVNQFNFDTISGGLFNFTTFNGGQTSGLQSDLDSVLANFA